MKKILLLSFLISTNCAFSKEIDYDQFINAEYSDAEFKVFSKKYFTYVKKTHNEFDKNLEKTSSKFDKDYKRINFKIVRWQASKTLNFKEYEKIHKSFYTSKRKKEFLNAGYNIVNQDLKAFKNVAVSTLKKLKKLNKMDEAKAFGESSNEYIENMKGFSDYWSYSSKVYTDNCFDRYDTYDPDFCKTMYSEIKTLKKEYYSVLNNDTLQFFGNYNKKMRRSRMEKKEQEMINQIKRQYK